MATIWKSTITIYSPFDPTKVELVDLAQSATDGASFCPFSPFPEIVDPATDPDFPHEFFDEDDED